MDSITDLVLFVKEELSNDHLTVAVFLDTRVAYDTVCHKHLLYALHEKGIRGHCLK